MKDLDFDELDRAVNSLIEKTTGTDEYEKDEEVLDVPVSGDFQSEPVVEQAAVEVAPVINTPPPIPNSPALAGRRSTGQFMDVVHPSSDMRRAPLAVPNRQPRIATEIPKVETSRAPIFTNEQPSTVKPMGWPDPIDFQGQKNEHNPIIDNSIDQGKDEDADINKIADEINQELSPEINESQESPFLSGAKVEKRPLGAFSDKMTEDDVEVQVDKSEDEYSANPLPAKSEKEPDLPAELQDNLLHIESDETEESEVSAESNIPAIDKVIDQLGEAEKPEVIQIEQSSINQQYKEQPSSGDQDSGAIYDTDSYHKSVIRPVKKKSGWLWVVWIVLLLILGASAGAAIYFLKVL